jgi:hypothetical protein
VRGLEWWQDGEAAPTAAELAQEAWEAEAVKCGRCGTLVHESEEGWSDWGGDIHCGPDFHHDPDPDGAPCCPDPGCMGDPCTFPGYAANH